VDDFTGEVIVVWGKIFVVGNDNFWYYNVYNEKKA